MTKNQIFSYFNSLYRLNEAQKLYLRIHGKRFEIVLDWLKHKNLSSVLDVGPSFLSELLYLKLGNKLSLIGFDASESLGGHLASNAILKKTHFIQQDLNFWDAGKTNATFDLIICAEVMEHLYTSPNRLFQNFYSSLNPKGYLIVQTPNAVALRKRLLLLFGKNPYEVPRENLKNPGHYREYTATELRQLATKTGFGVEKLIIDDYFEYPSLTSKIYRIFKNIIPPSLKSGITIILYKAEN